MLRKVRVSEKIHWKGPGRRGDGAAGEEGPGPRRMVDRGDSDPGTWAQVGCGSATEGPRVGVHRFEGDTGEALGPGGQV